MKKFFYFLPLILISCVSNHYHDGIYVRGLGVNNALQNEVLKVNGNEIFHYNYSFGGEFEGETKILCDQFEDRIEFTEDGKIKVLRIVDSGSLKLADGVIFTRFGNLNDSFAVTSKKPEPLIKKDGDNIILLGGKNHQAQNAVQDVVKTYSDGNISYSYISNVETDKNEGFFQGVKIFEGHIDDVYRVSISGNNIKITEPADADAVLVDGIIRDGKILNNDGKETKFRYKSPYLYYHGSSDEWYVFEELNEGD